MLDECWMKWTQIAISCHADLSCAECLRHIMLAMAE
jgi:hypothetical protein